MTFYDHERDHPIRGMVANPEWEVTLTRRAELYLEERARRQEQPEPNRFHIALAIIAVVGIAAALVGAWL